MPINRVGSKGIEDGAVATADLADNVVTSAKLGDGEVTNAKLANTTVTLAGESVALGASLSLTNKFVDWQSVTTADGSTFNTAVSGEGYFIDTTSAAHTITLPSSASRGDFIAIKDYAGTFATNNLTIARNGHNIQGVANDSLISTNRASLVLVYVDSTKGWLYWEEHNVADLQLNTFITATGGTITTSGDFKIHTFTGDGCFVVSTDGAGAGPSVVDYLVVAGGGGGGGQIATTTASGGGGAGGYRESHSVPVSGCYTASPLATPTGITVTATTYPVTVGAGGVKGDNVPTSPFVPQNGTQGSNSVFSTITSTGGGYGSGDPSPGSIGGPGGSGGGAKQDNQIGPAAGGGLGNTPPVSPSQGFPGGASDTGAPEPPGGTYWGGGGGGATQAGGNPLQAAPVSTTGYGGAGATTSISGSPTTYAGGGGSGASAYPGRVRGAGAAGPGGGGVGNPSTGPNGPTSGTANTGGGGGGGAGGANPYPSCGGAGGKGIVIIRYKFQ